MAPSPFSGAIFKSPPSCQKGMLQWGGVGRRSFSTVKIGVISKGSCIGNGNPLNLKIKYLILIEH